MEYSTPTTKITGEGIYSGSVQLKLINDSTLVSDRIVWVSQIEESLIQLVKDGILSPSENAYFPIHVASGIQVQYPSSNPMGAEKSCVTFCGFHTMITIKYPGYKGFPNLYYGIVVSTNGCKDLCNKDREHCTPFNQKGCGVNSIFTASHELAEAITDPEPGSGWFNEGNEDESEVTDVCHHEFTAVDLNGAWYATENFWSNEQNKCVAFGKSVDREPVITG
jgi:hypothetical protein